MFYMVCWNKLLLVGLLLGAMEAQCDDLILNQRIDASPAIEKVSAKEKADVGEEEHSEILPQTHDSYWQVENDIKDLVRHGAAQTPHGLSEARLANLELYILQLKKYRIMGVGSLPRDLDEDPLYSILFNRDMYAIELKKFLDKEGGEKGLTGKIIPLPEGAEIIREIQTSAGVSNFREIFDSQNERDYRFLKEQWSSYLQEFGGKCTLDQLMSIYHQKKNYTFLKERWEPFFRAAGVDFSLDGVATLYDRDMNKNSEVATLYDRDMSKSREVVMLYDEDMKNNIEVLTLYDRDKTKGSIEKGIIVEYIRERKFAFINNKTKVTKYPELYQYTENGCNYIIWTIEIDHQRNYIIYTVDKKGNIVASIVDKNIPIDELDCYDKYREPCWD